MEENKDILEKTEETVENAAEAAAEAVKEAADQAAETVQEAADQAAGTVQEAADKAAETVETAAEKAAEPAKDALEELKEASKEAEEGITGRMELPDMDAAQPADEEAEALEKAAEAAESAAPPIQQETPRQTVPAGGEEEFDDEDEDDEDDEEEHRGHGKVIALVIILAAIAGLYLWGRYYFAGHFYPGTIVNEYDASRMTAGELKRVMQEDLTNFNLTIKERNNRTETIVGSEISLKYTESDEVDQIVEGQNENLWFMDIFGSKYYTVGGATEYDEAQLEEKIDSLECLKPMNSAPPEDAYITRKNDAFVIEPEKEGTTLNRKKTVEVIKNALATGSYNVNLDAEGAYEAPKVFSDDEELVAKAAELNEMTTAHIIYNFSDRFWEVDSDLIASWLVKDEAGNYYLDESLVRAWVTDMAYETDTFGLKHRFMTSYGVEVELEAGGDYGWCIDKDDTTAHLIQYINEHANVEVQPDYLYTALDRSINDIGNTYVEVCISSQHLWCYSNGQLVVDTPVITGRVADGYATPSGSCWAIDGKKDDWQFTGYSNAHSDYWMPFNGPVGLHDASWQDPSFYTIPDYYYNYGSHGCVNMPLDAARIVFQHMEIGYPVIVYYSVDQVHGPDNTERLVEGW